MRKKALLFIIFCTVAFSQLFAQNDPHLMRVHYFYNSGWLVETSHHLLLFDFVPNKEAKVNMSVLQEKLQQAGRGKKPLMVFISHDHSDHFTDSIYSLANGRKDVEFILGWKPKQAPAVSGVSILGPGDSLVNKTLTVYTHPATDDGSAFLVKINDLTIYHAGDHALWAGEIMSDYTRELQAIGRKATAIDLAFLPAARGLFTKCAVDSVMEKSVALAINILRPKTVALQHIGCADQLFQYERIRQKMPAQEVKWIIPKKYNEAISNN